MIEIGRSLPNLTVPMVTTGAAEFEELKANFPRFAATIAAEQVGSTLFGPAIRISGLRQSSPQGCRSALLHRRKGGRRQELADDVADDLAVGFRLGSRIHPVRIGHERAPLLLAL